MRPREHRDAGLGKKVLEGVRAVDRAAHERDIGGGGGQPGRRVVVVGQAQADLELGLGGLQVREDRGRQLGGGEHRVADAQRRCARGAARLLDGGRGLRKDAARRDEQRLAGGGQRQALPVAPEELDPKAALELGDRRAQRLLRDEQTFGRPREAPLLGDGDEVAQLANLRQHSCRL
jgi:hypothetical protein